MKYRVFIFCLILFSAFACKKKTESPTITLEFDDPDLYEPVDIDYSVEGNGDTTLFFIHGLSLDRSYWQDQVKVFSKQFKVVTIDLAGHGNSGRDRTHWTVKSFSKDLIEIIKDEDLKNIILIGHSMGGDIALDVADSIPQSVIGLIGVDNFKDVNFTMDEDFKKGLFDYIMNWRVDHRKQTVQFVRNMLDSATSETVANRIIKSYQSADLNITLSIFKNLFPAMEQEKAKLEKLRFPLRLIINDHPPRNEEAWKALPGGYFVSVMENTGHFPMVERPEEFNNLLWKALKNKQ